MPGMLATPSLDDPAKLHRLRRYGPGARLRSKPTSRSAMMSGSAPGSRSATPQAWTARVLPGPESLLSHLQRLIVDMMAEGAPQ